MTEDRRYSDQETREIFETAAAAGDSDRRALTPREGLALAELQEIGREVGLSPGRVADAAASLDLHPREIPRETFMRMPISVGRSVDLRRAPTDREWELLVGELRETFNAQGKVGTSGSIRCCSR